jgi:hypothetical protein
MGIGLTQLVAGAQANEWFKDSPADQRAIISGYFHANKIRAYHYSYYQGFGAFFDYTVKRPDWFNQSVFTDLILRAGRRRK